jgi:hypothetical protein
LEVQVGAAGWANRPACRDMCGMALWNGFGVGCGQER